MLQQLGQFEQLGQLEELQETEIPGAVTRADHYDDPLYDYAQYWDNREYEHAAEVTALKRLLDGKHFKHAIDMGGGYGRLSIELKNYADMVTLAEPSRQQLRLAESFLGRHQEIAKVLMRGHKLDLPDGSANLITFIRVMHHLPDPAESFTEISRLLSVDGYAVIEAANYMHARNRLKHIMRHQKIPDAPVDIRSPYNRQEEEVPFVNHNPRTVHKQLAHAGLKVERILSVSNLRSKGIKKVMSKRMMVAIEGFLQPTLAQAYFGPSIFFLVKKA